MAWFTKLSIIPVFPSTTLLVKENHGVLKGVRVHFGTMGVVPREEDIIDSIPPSYFGGNIDDWRIGKGGTMYYPIVVQGGLLSLIPMPHKAIPNLLGRPSKHL